MNEGPTHAWFSSRFINISRLAGLKKKSRLENLRGNMDTKGNWISAEKRTWAIDRPTRGSSFQHRSAPRPWAARIPLRAPLASPRENVKRHHVTVESFTVQLIHTGCTQYAIQFRNGWGADCSRIIKRNTSDFLINWYPRENVYKRDQIPAVLSIQTSCSVDLDGCRHLRSRAIQGSNGPEFSWVERIEDYILKICLRVGVERSRVESGFRI